MTKKKRTRLNDQPIEGFADLEDELPVSAHANHRAAPAEPAARPHHAAAPEPVPEPEPDPAPAAPHRAPAVHRAPSRRSSAMPPWGTLYAASVISAGIGMGGAMLLLTGSGADRTWNPGALLVVQNYLSPTEHPFNLVALLSVVVGFLAIVGARALDGTLRRFERERAAGARLVDKLTALRLDNEGPWTDAALRDHPTAGSFVAEVLGAWRLQSARLRRVSGVEGELHRLQKALVDNDRDVLTGRFDSPAVGALADGMVRFLDASNADARELAELRRHNHDESAAIVTLVQDARLWNRTTLEQIGTQGAALERMARRLEDLGAALVTATPAAGGQASALLAEIRRELAQQPGSATAPSAGLDDLAAQGSKLAFQIAMEVARLGPRGERLQPMSQSLEQMTTSLRQVIDEGAAANGPARNFGAILGKLDALSGQLERGGPAQLSPEAMEEISRSGPVIGRVASNLADIARRFQAQAERLTKLGESFSALTGAPFDTSMPAAGQPEPSPDAGLRVVEQDPFCRDAGARAPVDPFTIDTPLAAPPPRPVLSPEPPVVNTPAAMAPAAMAPAAEPMPSAAVPQDDGFIIERGAAGGSLLDAQSDASIEPLELETMVPSREEELPEPVDRPVVSDLDRIYDLSEFGAVRIEAQDAPARQTGQAGDLGEPEGPVYELAEFGAVRVA